MYKINNIDLSTLGIIPLQNSGQSLAVSGVLDFPARKGKTEHSWGTETEAFVAEDDIEFEGREIVFYAMMKASTTEVLNANLLQLIVLCKTGIVQFETPCGIFPVVLTGDIKVEEWSEKGVIIEAKFTQFVVSFVGDTGEPTGGDGYLIDDYNLQSDFGICVLKEAGSKSLPVRIGVNTTDNYTISAYREPRDIALNCFMKGSDIADLVTKMGKFQKLLSLPGLRALSIPGGSGHNTYVKGGFKVTNIYTGAGASCQFTLILREP